MAFLVDNFLLVLYELEIKILYLFATLVCFSEHLTSIYATIHVMSTSMKFYVIEDY